MTLDDLPPATKPRTTWEKTALKWGVVVVSVGAVLVMVIPNARRVQVVLKQNHDVNNMRQLGLATHNFAEVLDSELIGPYAQVSPGVLNTEMSFRVNLMPYMEHDDRYRKIDLTQPWDSPRNTVATSEPLRYFQSPDTPDRSKPNTPYRVFYGGGALFEADGAPVKLNKIPDGSSNTILFVHATETVPWAKPQEFPYARTTPLPPLGSRGLSRDGFNAAFADGSVRFVRHAIPEADLRSLIEKADGRDVVIK